MSEKLTVNERAVEWWATRYHGPDKAGFKAALLKALPEGDWSTYNDYDPQGVLLTAVREVTKCAGFMFSGDGLFPRKTGLDRNGDRLIAKEGYGGPWEEVRE